MSQRLLWLQEDKAVISDMNGSNIYRFNVTENHRISSFLTTFAPRTGKNSRGEVQSLYLINL